MASKGRITVSCFTLTMIVAFIICDSIFMRENDRMILIDLLGLTDKVATNILGVMDSIFVIVAVVSLEILLSQLNVVQDELAHCAVLIALPVLLAIVVCLISYANGGIDKVDNLLTAFAVGTIIPFGAIIVTRYYKKKKGLEKNEN